jgi:mannose-6-phosphate isomerase-like protein (cupin superfamily)
MVRLQTKLVSNTTIKSVPGSRTDVSARGDCIWWSAGPTHREGNGPRLKIARLAKVIRDANIKKLNERSAPGFRIAELQISPTQKVPWHYHNNVQHTFYVIAGTICIFLGNPKEQVCLRPGQTYSIRPKRPHLITNAADFPLRLFRAAHPRS